MALSTQESSTLWHLRLGHPGSATLNSITKNHSVKGMNPAATPDIIPCDSCVMAKHSKNPFPTNAKVQRNKLELIHSDVCGPFPTCSYGGSKYFVTFTDDSTKKTWIYLLKQKSQVLESFKIFKQEVENLKSIKILWIRTDNGGEYTSNQFIQFCQEEGIIKQSTVPHTPQQNGISERLNRTILEKARALLVHSNREIELWGEAVSTAVYLKNRTPPIGSPKTPEELWSGNVPSITRLRVWGCNCLFKIEKPENKLSTRSRRGILVGYSETQKGYRIFIPDSKKITITRDVKFDENTFGGTKNQNLIKFFSFNNGSKLPSNTLSNHLNPWILIIPAPYQIILTPNHKNQNQKANQKITTHPKNQGDQPAYQTSRQN